MTGNDRHPFSGQAKQRRPRRVGDTASTTEGGISHAAPARARHWLSNEVRHALGNRTVSRLPVGGHYATHSTANNVSYDKSLGGPPNSLNLPLADLTSGDRGAALNAGEVPTPCSPVAGSLLEYTTFSGHSMLSCC